MRFGNHTYRYNANGIRLEKTTASGVVHKYWYEGDRLYRELRGTTEILYFYDGTGIEGFSVDGVRYHYQKNAQGDIVRIFTDSGAIIAKYFYDAWGNHKTTTFRNTTANTSATFIGNINPFRYRGYYFDAETGLYYLQSRYYDPQYGRFINADDVSYLDKKDLTGGNLYAYCANNPVMYADPSGHMPDWLRTVVDIGMYIVSAVIAIAVGVRVARTTTLGRGIAAGVMTFGAINNLTNAVYYNYFANEKSTLNASSYQDGYINRWDRLDYVKTQTQQAYYNNTAWMYYSEYNLHMYGWFVLQPAYTGNEGDNFLSEMAYKVSVADIKIGDWDPRWYIKTGSIIIGLLGL